MSGLDGKDADADLDLELSTATNDTFAGREKVNLSNC